MPKLKSNSPIHDTLTGYDFQIDEPLSRTKAIRQKSLECCCGNAAEVRRCQITDCTLWPWRHGRGSLARLRTSKNDPLSAERPESEAQVGV